MSSNSPDPGTTPQPTPEGTRATGTGTLLARWSLLGLVILITAGVGLAIQMRFTPRGRYGEGGQVETAGSVEVTARLIELPGQFLPDDGLYNYAFVLKYEVLEIHRGSPTGKTIYVAHYNPRKRRGRVADEFYPDLGGTVSSFRAADIHRLALQEPLDDHYIGAIVDRYDEVKGKTVYWGLWTNLVGSNL